MLLAHTGLSSDFFICRREVLIALLAVLLLYFALKKQIAEIKVERISQNLDCVSFGLFCRHDFCDLFERGAGEWEY